jgi:hypothetical protein
MAVFWGLIGPVCFYEIIKTQMPCRSVERLAARAARVSHELCIGGVLAPQESAVQLVVMVYVL